MRFEVLNQFLSGAIMMGFFVAALFFCRFWTRTRDRLFAIFAIAFGMMSVERFFFLLIDAKDEARTWVYLIRLLAFIILIVGIVDKNSRR